MLNKKFFSITLVFLLYSLAFSQGFLKRQNKLIVDGNGNEIILRAVGLGGWMLQEGYMLQTGSFANAQYEIRAKIEELIGEDNTNLFYDAWLANHCRKADIDSIASWGFNSIRLPMHYNLFTLPIEEEPISGNNTWIDKGFEMVDSLLEWCDANEIYLILDLHGAPGGQGEDAAISDYDPSKPSLWESAENRAKTVALWRKLAERYADEFWIGGYDLLNETNWNLPGNALLKQLYYDITNAIREVDTNHIIFIEGNWWANDFTGLTPPWDNNMAYSFHKYWSHNDTGSIMWMLQIRNQHSVPIWCGEFGENSNVWFTDAIKLFEESQIGWASWPLKKIESISGSCSIEKPPEYQTLIDYWEGNGAEPSVSFAFDALMELTEKLKIENCRINKDVIDAMIRQPLTDTMKAYKQLSVPGTIWAVDYNLGQNSFAYFDTEVADYHVSTGNWTGWNNGWSYRNDGVDIEEINDSDGAPYTVGWTDSGEWLKYTLSAAHSDSYNISIRVASQDGGGILRLLLNNENLTGMIDIPKTNGWYNWETVETGECYIPKGRHTIKLQFINGGFNINQFEFSRTYKIEESENNPDSYCLFQNYPNPFNSATIISYRIPIPATVNLTIYNVTGQLVKTLINEKMEAEDHTVIWNTQELNSGIYFYKISTSKFSQVKKCILLK